MNNITRVLIAVAKLEFTFATPTFAKIAVKAANKADRIAYNCHIKIKEISHHKKVKLL
jgi:hypothetical protein